MEKMERGKRRVKKGIVIAHKTDKTAVVEIETVYPHPKYKKIVRVYKKFLVHDAENKAKTGDVVEIIETRPLSKLKCHRILKIVGQGKVKSRELPKKKEKEEEKSSDTAEK